MKKNYLLFLFLLITFSQIFGQEIDSGILKKSIQPQKTEYTIGEEVTLVFDLTLKPKHHSYSVIPTDGALPTTIEFDSKNGFEVIGKSTESPKPKKVYDEDLMSDTYYFDDHVTYYQKVKIKSENVKLQGVIKYQVCVDGAGCRPVSSEFSFNLKAKPSKDAKSEIKPDSLDKKNDEKAEANDTLNKTLVEKSDTNKPKETVLTVSNKDDNGELPTNLFYLFIEAFLLGLVGLLTPCVYPMIPMTVSFFTKRSGTRQQGIKNAFMYAGSIIFIYVFLGLAVSLIFGGDTIYKIASSPWTNLIFFFVTIIFGLSFLGWFEIALPSSWLNAADKQGDKGGMVGIFFMAVTLALVSFSCTGPLVGTLLIDAAKGKLLGPIVGMTGYSLAFALPFGLFALFPAWLNSLPKSGGWLNTVKVILGFLELALAFKFLSSADLVWHTGLVDREIYLGAWIVIFSMLGMYLMGWIILPHDNKIEKIPVPRLIMAMSSFWFVMYMIPGLWGAELKMLATFLPNSKESIGVRVLSGGNSGNANQSKGEICDIKDRKMADILAKDTPDGYCAFFDLEEALAYAKKVNKPVFVDFTGHSCTNCRWMEINIWTDKEVKAILSKDFVLVSLYVDEPKKLPEIKVINEDKKLRTVGDLWIEYQNSTFGTNSQPYYVIMDADKKVLTKKNFAYNSDKTKFIEFLNEGLKK